MKMFKKLAAVIMAAAMALTLLTACGGGGGGSSVLTFANSKTGKLLSSLSNSESFYIEMGSDIADSHVIMATDGTKAYMLSKGTIQNGDASYPYNQEMYDDGTTTYIVDNIGKTVTICATKDVGSSSAKSTVNSFKSAYSGIDDSKILSIKAGTEKIGATSYQTETVTTSEGTSTFYYLNGELKYVSSGSEAPVACTFKTSFDTSILTYSERTGYTTSTATAD